MLRSTLRRMMDVNDSDSFVSKLRLKRLIVFNGLFNDMPKPVTILDIGGTINFWEKMGFAGSKDYEITVLNLSKIQSNYTNIKTVAGDARDLSIYSSNQFDLLFSNSVIEHVGEYEDQLRMAEEVRRVGKKYFVQTPNYYFPFEPHFLFPCFQFFPLWIKVLLIRNFNLGHHSRHQDKAKAIECAKSAKLLRKNEVKILFPDGNIHEEKMFMMSYSILVYKN